MGDDENVIPLRPAEPPAAPQPDSGEPKSIEQLTAFCERVEEGLQYMTTVLVGLESRLRRLELAWNKAEKQKLQATAIYNPQGDRVN